MVHIYQFQLIQILYQKLQENYLIKNGYLLLPTITYGNSFEHAPFFNLSIRESTLRTVLIDLCTSLLENNIKTIFIINGHHGNLKSIKNIDVTIRKKI